MPAESSAVTSQRLLRLLSILQTAQSRSATDLAERLATTPRTIRRDVERLRELGYTIETTRGPIGGYRLGSGTRLPPLLLDDEQALAIAITLRTADVTGSVDADAASRALEAVTRLLPSHLAHRARTLEVGAASEASAPVEPAVLLRISEAISRSEELRFDYAGRTGATGTDPRPPSRTQPHHVLLHRGRWYVIGWSPSADGWRIYRVDRMTLRSHNGAHFSPRSVPGGDATTFLAARFKGSSGANEWPCTGTVLLGLPAADVAPFADDGIVEHRTEDTCAFTSGAWSWAALAASLGRFDADIRVIDPPELRRAFADLASRFSRAATDARAGGE